MPHNNILNLVNAVFTTSIEERDWVFSVSRHFFLEEDLFDIAYHGENFKRWFRGTYLDCEPETLIFCSSFQKPFHESDIMDSLSIVKTVSLAQVYILVKSNSLLLGSSNLFLSTSPATGLIHLLVLLKRGSRWSVRGYDEKVREEREWFSGFRFLGVKPL